MDGEVEEEVVEAAGPVVTEVELCVSQEAPDEDAEIENEDDAVQDSDGGHVDASGGGTKAGEDQGDEAEDVAQHTHHKHQRDIDSEQNKGNIALSFSLISTSCCTHNNNNNENL